MKIKTLVGMLAAASIYGVALSSRCEEYGLFDVKETVEFDMDDGVPDKISIVFGEIAYGHGDGKRTLPGHAIAIARGKKEGGFEKEAIISILGLRKLPPNSMRAGYDNGVPYVDIYFERGDKKRLYGLKPQKEMTEEERTEKAWEEATTDRRIFGI